MRLQLSISGADVQPATNTRLLSLALVASMLVVLSNPAVSQHLSIELQIAPLSDIDRRFMNAQRAKIEALANREGRQLGGIIRRDLETLQVILDTRMIPRDDTLTQQALGIVLGDLLATNLNMQWVVYRDRAGRSRALKDKLGKIFIFPITMISRRYGSGAKVDVTAIYDKQAAKVNNIRPRDW